MSPQKINRISLGLLLLGLGSALAIFLSATSTPEDPAFGDPLADKKYLLEMRKIGGNANVIASEFQAWFGGLWHGEMLAATVAVLTVGAILAFRFVALRPGFLDVLLARDESAPVRRPSGMPPRDPGTDARR